MSLGSKAANQVARFAAGFFLVAGNLSGCALIIPQTEALRHTMPAGLPAHVELSEVPFFPQEDYQCGPAALATVLATIGVNVKPDDVAGQVYLPARQGSLQVEMLAAARRYGMVSYRIAPKFENLLREVAAGNPVIILQDFGVWPFSIWHYAVAAGYDYENRELVLRSGTKARLVVPFAVIEYTWKESDYWAIVVVPPDRIPATANESDYLSAIAALEHAGNPRSARQAYATFLRRWPNNVTAMVGLANSLYAIGELRETEATLRAASSRYPEAVVVLNNLAQALSDEGQNEEALAVIERASALEGPLASAVQETKQLILKRISESNSGRAPR